MVEVNVSVNPLDVKLLDVNLTITYVSGGPITLIARLGIPMWQAGRSKYFPGDQIV